MDIVTLALSKKFTEDTAIQVGAVKGANCKIAGYRDLGEKTELTFSWKNDSNETRQTVVLIPNGISVSSAVINEESHLILMLTNGTAIDAGEVKAEVVLEQDLTATVEIGTVKNGKKYEKGTPLENILRDMLIKTEVPVVTLALTPSTTVYDIVSETITSLTMKATVTRKTYDVSRIDFYADSVLIHSVTEGVTAGGSFNFIYAPESPLKQTTVFKVVATDVEGNKSVETVANKITVSFVGKSYYGYVEPDVGEPTEAQIKALDERLKIVKGFVYEGATYPYNKMVYAYPVEFGALASIKDIENNINYTNSYTRTTLKIDDIDYYCYTQNNASKAAGINITFA